MAITDVMQVDYWHVVLNGSRKDVSEALKIFPGAVVTHDRGWFTKNIRAYHSGGAVKIDGTKAGVACVECQFPNFETVPGLKHYSPIVSTGFRFDRHFDSEDGASEMLISLLDKSFTFSDLQQGATVRGKKINGREYWAATPEYYFARGIVSSKDFKRVLNTYQDFKELGGVVGDIFVSPFNKFRLESDRVL